MTAVEASTVDLGQWQLDFSEKLLWTDPRTKALTQAERNVLLHLLTFLSDKEIATQLGVKPRTIAARSRAIYRKMAVQDRLGLFSWYTGLPEALPRSAASRSC